jgi:uncharacterized protein YrrD
MFKGRDVIGKPVVSYDVGEKFDVVEDLIFDQESNQLLGFLVRESSWFKPAQVLLLSDVQAIGVDAVITSSQGAIAKASQIPAVSHILDYNTILKGTRILTMDGRDLGVIVDLYFDENSGRVEGYEVSGGLFADAYSGRSFVPALQTLKIGRDVAFVPTETAQLMEEQVGGLRGAMQSVSDKLQETAQVTGDRLQELGQTASDRFQDTAQVTGDKLHELGQTAVEKAQDTAQVTHERLQNLGQLASEKAQGTVQIAGGQLHGLGRTTATSLTNAIIDPAEQKAFVVGRIVERDVITHTGSLLALQGQPITAEIAEAAEALGILDDLYRATGGSWSDPLGARLNQAVASFTVEQAQGRRVRYLVRTEAGSILAAPGQIVTPQIIDRAKAHHRERLLLQSVGLSTGEALHGRTSNTMTQVGDSTGRFANRLQGTTATAGDQFQAGARGFWSQLQETASTLKHRSTEAIEEKQIKGALGRPVTRVILGQQDEVILNVGELITHQAIASSRQAQVLDLLLNSVYTDKPQLSLDNLRAPQAGTAAL